MEEVKYSTAIKQEWEHVVFDPQAIQVLFSPVLQFAVR